MLKQWFRKVTLDAILFFSRLSQAEYTLTNISSPSNETLLVQDISPIKYPILVFEPEPLAQVSTISGGHLPRYSPTTVTTMDRSTPQENDTVSSNDSVIDNCHFMSFEEWKKQKKELVDVSMNISKNRTEMANSAVSMLSKNATIDNKTINNNTTTTTTTTTSSANGKIYKDKFNFASVDCGATVVETNAQAKGASAILRENKDTYLLNRCSIPNKYVIVELCQDILVGQVVLGNFEFFSSMFEDIRFSVSDRFPSSNWKELGQFKAQNIRDLQFFKIENPLIWARFLKLEILSHYGNEFYCPLSLLRVHGKTMIEELKEDEEKLKQEQDNVANEALQNEVSEKRQTIIDDESLLLNDSMNECPVILPHLRLNEFLEDINHTSEKLCLPQEEIVSSTATKLAATITTQESIYKNFMKRLQLLESNATLSLLYIEEQSKLLSMAFSNLEKRQTIHFNSLMNSVNSTLLHQLALFKDSYNQLHEQYGNLFKLQEKNYKQYLTDSIKQMRNSHNEMAFQKRVTIFNSLLIVCLLAYLVLTKDINIEVQDQNMEVGGVGGEGRGEKEEKLTLQLSERVIISNQRQETEPLNNSKTHSTEK
ncbi:hypothetical protein KGF56_000406 [Candida oxycetoniae]|uniref:SUN-like protein 1 n=1 Tax=Candida oxycetoniae TaxID=497107 RepID=A0AAI9T0V0_9ASCO|nr:uncharacterized protein KGF56_000406 [Candida oxycetoniae]KAI3406801.2 hypothetical protein KGF56_000406 [Candida oxycetoniae]